MTYLTTSEARKLGAKMKMPGCYVYPHGQTPPYKLAANGIDLIVDMDKVRADGKDV